MFYLVFYGFLILCQLLSVENVFYPPSFTKQPPKDAVYNKLEALVLPCKADGNPPPKYVWYKHDKDFNYQINMGRYARWPNEGTLILARPNDDDDGIYYCEASNSRGKALSVRSTIRRSEMQDFIPIENYNHDNVMEGSSLTLNCRAPVSYPPPIITWEKKKDGKVELLKNSNKYVINIDSNLYITRVTYSDDNNAEFVCTASNSIMRIRKTDKPHKVTVKKADQNNKGVSMLYRSIRNAKAVIGGKVEFQCILGGNPAVNYRWSKVGLEGSILDRPNIRQEAGGPYLVIEPVTEIDAGIYMCTGSNKPSPVPLVLDFELKVYEIPRLTTGLTDHNVPLGGSLEITCKANGNPQPQIIWTVNGGDINLYLNGGTKRKEGDVIYLSNLRDNDTAVFQCNATNNYGYDYANGYVNIMQDKPEFMRQMPPEIIRAENTPVELLCETFSAPKAVVSWFKDGYPINGGRYSVNMTNGNLQIEKLIPADSGQYSCIAKNIYGNVSASTQLKIRQRTQLMIRPVNTWVYTGQEVKFVCTAKTDRLETHNLRIDWYVDTTLLDMPPNGRIRTNPQDNSLIIMGAVTTDTGIYTCNATNGLDFDVAYASLVVQGAPYQPSKISVDCKTYAPKNLARVTWSPGGDNYAPIIDYIVEYSTQYDPEVWYKVETSNNSNVGSISSIVKTLGQEISVDVLMRPHIHYTFRVRAMNRVGISDPSDVKPDKSSNDPECKIPEAPPSSNPSQVFVYSSESNNLIVQWTPMPLLEHNGPNFLYEILLHCLNCDNVASDIYNNTKVANWWESQVVYTSLKRDAATYTLEKYKTFEAKVSTRNDKGASTAPPTVATGYSGDDVPSLKVNDLTLVSLAKGAIKLQWTVVAENQIKTEVKGFFRGYRIEWCLQGLSKQKCNDTRQYQDVVLRQHNAPILFLSRKKRSIGDGGQVVNFMPLASGVDGHTDSQSEDNDILIRHKRQTVYPNANSWSFDKPIVVDLTMVPGDIGIKVWVRVLNNLFAGPIGNILELTTHEDTPGPVTNFNQRMIGINHVVVEWTKPSMINGKLMGYRLGWREIMDLELGYMTKYPDINDPEATVFQMSGLQSNTKYRILIWALTSQGEGVDSFIDVSTLPANIAPNAPRFNIMNVDLNKINLTYQPSELGVKGSVFFAQFRKYGQYRYDDTEPEYIKNWIYLDNLANDTLYEIRVVATNGAGMATPSEIQSVKTGGRVDPTRLVNYNAIWFICLIILLALVIIALVLLLICRERRWEALFGESYPRTVERPQQPYTLNSSDISASAPYVDGSNISAGSRKYQPGETDLPMIVDEPDFPTEDENPPSYQQVISDTQSGASDLASPRGRVQQPMNDEEPLDEMLPDTEVKPPRRHKKKKRRNKPQEPEDEAIFEDQPGDDTII